MAEAQDHNRETRLPEAEIERQRGIMDQIAANGVGKYWINTYGCQMNVRDSQTLAGMLEGMGYEKAAEQRQADLILFNTCCVRENAERRVFGNVGHLQALKKERPNLIVGVCGCMMQQDGSAERLLSSAPFVSLVFGTHNLYRFPELLQGALKGERLVAIEGDPQGVIAEGLPAQREGNSRAFVNIMFGCNNFCSYCIVPFVRGRERSRAMGDILREIEGLSAQGIKEVTLLGQNVNSYAPEGGGSFPKLLKSLEGLVPRLRFMTSHPKDLSDELIEAMASSKTVCPQLHLPVQAGSNAILQAMNRGYTREKYLGLVEKLRDAMPEIGLSTDFIAGFPGETESDFAQTLDLCAKSRFDSAFTFIYSRRSGTKAAKMEGQIPSEIQHERLSRLIALQEGITAEKLRAMEGKEYELLIEEPSRRSKQDFMGRTGSGIAVNLHGEGLRPGDFARAKMVASGANTLRGELISE
ncbi:MAG: tRNA (N6-isopentenyl adenosine(37)-C2)-methylthiotransferase MiaB [Christensenellaceae bacterium]|jgi:tRNA-2-methylthio-N6-dimethylallyladenosine synthase|nr:tRNA (N6-isopentenyl adenosine(37)-C2)-methylthiotransferase MiaB [Christensenellaceae bacterium]